MSRTNSNARARTGEPREVSCLVGADVSPGTLHREWEELCARHLPLGSEDSFWRFSRARAPEDPAQGWKLHVSATVLTACDVLRRVAAYLTARGVLFKAPRSLAELSQLNCGLYYGYSQIGKFITVYPKSTEQSLVIARALHRLTRGLSAPSVPFDLRYRPDSCVFYRYGAFDSLTVGLPDGTQVPAIRTPDESLVPDRRARGGAVPAWLTDPFPGRRARFRHPASPLGTSIFAYKALSQRGKGGVYKALDVSGAPARLCILKEGRRHGETAWDGRDGYWRVRHECRALDALARAGVQVPAVYMSFQSEVNYYLVTELIDGSNLQEIISNDSAPPSPWRALQYGLLLSMLLAEIHSAGWVWRDCKPSNLMITEGGAMRPLDFEGAYPVDDPDPAPWGTLGYVPPEWHDRTYPALGVAQDLYALGAVLHQLFYGRVPESHGSVVARHDLIPEVGPLVSSLLDPSPDARPCAGAATEILRGTLDGYCGSQDESQPLTFRVAASVPYYESAGGGY